MLMQSTTALYRLVFFLFLLIASIASAIAAGPWQISYTYSGDEQYFPCPGMGALLNNGKPYNEIPVNGNLLGAGFNGTSTMNFPGDFGLFRAQVNSIVGNTQPVDAMFETGFYRNPSPEGTWVDVQVDWVGAGAPPVTANVNFRGLVWAARSNVMNAEGTKAILNFWVTDLVQETTSPTMALETPPLNSTSGSQTQQVVGIIPLTILNGHGHYLVRFQAHNRLSSPGNPVTTWTVLTDTRLYIRILP